MLQICKLCYFYQGGMTYTDLCDMPMDEFLMVIENSDIINKECDDKLRR